MKSAVILTNGRFRLVSYGNGLAYDLQDTRARLSTFVQGDSATRFRETLDALEESFPNQSVLPLLWDEMGYGDIATAMGCE